MVAVLGPDPVISGGPVAAPGPGGGSLMFDGEDDRAVVADDLGQLGNLLPSKHFTIAAWVSVNTPQSYGGIFSVIQDNGSHEKGWVLGYGKKHFYLALSSEGADDGDGFLTYLQGTSIYELGRMAHVVGTFDGEEMRIYVNGKLEASSKAQSGKILYPSKAPVILAGYRDSNEDFLHHGRIREVRIFHQTASAEWVARDFALDADLVGAAPFLPLDPEFRMRVSPFLQGCSPNSMTVTWETSRPSTSVVRYGSTEDLPLAVEGQPESLIHQVKLEGLPPDTPFLYRVESVDDQGRKLESEVRTFQTAPEAGTPFAFAVISDTQSNPKVAKKIAQLAWAKRPHFLLHPGDLVGTGTDRNQWLRQFFPSMEPLISRVALFPVLGNHEQDARYYYDYMALPPPEYFYEFRFGNAHFFLLDSNRRVDPESEQYKWLEKQMKASDARWKFVCYHHPAYSSDDDYGAFWKGPPAHGVSRMRAMVPLFDRYGVDIVWNGHVHSYERTWPMKAGEVVEEGGTIYMVTGGGGGGLEVAGPARPSFQNNIRRGHHWCYIAINGGTLEMKAYDLEGHLFDVLTLRKP